VPANEKSTDALTPEQIAEMLIAEVGAQA